MQNDEIIVSVICLAYNHEKFIEETIKGFISQKTQFGVEFIIHDDVSKDNTREIINRYVKKYPGVIIPFFEEKNQYSQNVNLFRLIAERAKGKYIAICEGDDYWCDKEKLTIQVKYMEDHPECSLYMHNGYILNNMTGEKRKMNPYSHEGILSIHEVLIEKHLPPTASMVCRKEDLVNQPEEVFGNSAGVEDRPLRMFLCTRGNIYYSNRPMCIYRTNTDNSFSSNTNNKKSAKKVLDGMNQVYMRYDNYTEKKYHRDVKMMISREKYLYYLRCGEYLKCLKNRYFYSCISFKQKLGTLKKIFLK